MLAPLVRVQRASRIKAGVPLVLTGALLFACSEETTAPGMTPQLALGVTGGYTIRAINGSRLPVTVCSGEVKVTSGSLRLRADRTFLAVARFSSPPSAPRETYQEAGTYTRRPGTDRLVFTSRSRPGTVWTGIILADGSLRVRYPVCGEVHVVRVVPA